jgi:hypothetical protein
MRLDCLVYGASIINFVCLCVWALFGTYTG